LRDDICFTNLTQYLANGHNLAGIADEFPILQQKIFDQPLVYLDNAASTQKPQLVLDAIQHYYQRDHANVHRGVHTLSERATQAYENSRKTLQNFINAARAEEIIFTRGTTEAINLVAYSFGRLRLRAGDEILISAMEHHANIVPWQEVCIQTGATLRVIPLTAAGEIDLTVYAGLLNARTQLVAITHVSHVLGVVNPVKAIIAAAHQQQIPVLVDGAQAVAHLPVDVQDLDCDFYVFSGHKLYGPTGIGVLYGKSVWLRDMPPYQTGGGMIQRVSFTKTEYADFPARFEAGTPHIAGAVGLSAAINFIRGVGFARIIDHEQALTAYALEKLAKVSGVRVLGNTLSRIGVISLVMAQAHPHDIATILDSSGVAVRAGHHCAMPLMELLQVPATVRVSLGLYNSFQDIDRLITALQKVIQLFDPHPNLSPNRGKE
jgi:cysteine desulfurase / selenocysteine lyase